MAEYQLGIIGAGNMAEAVVRGALSSRFVAPEAIVASDPAEARRELFEKELGVACVTDNTIPARCPRVMLAIKPGVIDKVLDEIANVVMPDATIISIVASVHCKYISEKLGGKGRIIRVMPNMPLLAGTGMSVLSKCPGATDDDLNWTDALFSACGLTAQVNEEMLDAVTAISGCGPAYFFYLIEAMVEAGVAEGLDKDLALKLAIQTCLGSAEMLKKTNESPETLRAKISTKGGITEAATRLMDENNVHQHLVAAVRRAAQRSRELAR